MGIVSMLRRWRARHLLIAWLVYWVVLLLVSLRSALRLIFGGLTAPGTHGSVGASFENSNFVLKVTAGAETYTSSTSLMTMLLWFAGPPLVLFLVWLVTRRSPVAERDPERDYRIS